MVSILIEEALLRNYGRISCATTIN